MIGKIEENAKDMSELYLDFLAGEIRVRREREKIVRMHKEEREREREGLDSI